MGWFVWVSASGKTGADMVFQQQELVQYQSLLPVGHMQPCMT